MKELDRQELPACSSVERHDVSANGAVATPRAPSLRVTGPAAAPILVIVGGPFAHPAARAQAGRIARQRSGEALCLALFTVEEDTPQPKEADLAELHAGFHAVIVVTRGQREQVASRLLRTILTLDGQDQWIACDWHDVSHIVRTSRSAPVRFGSGRAMGSERASLAVLAAIRQADRQGPGLRVARGLCIGIRAASRTIGGWEIKEVIHQIRARVGPSAAVAMSISADSALEAGACEVDLFAFGQFDELALAGQGAGADDAVLDSADNPEAERQTGEGLRDPLYAAARSLVVQNRRASISLVQRYLRIGYGRASRLLDSMEGDILSARDADGNRGLLVPDRNG